MNPPPTRPALPQGARARLAIQLVPAVLVAAVGGLALAALSRAPAPAPVAEARSAVPIEAEMTATWRPRIAEPGSVDKTDAPRSTGRVAERPAAKVEAAHAAGPQATGPGDARASAGAPLSIAPPSAPAPVHQAAAASLLDLPARIGTAAGRLPTAMREAATGWFAPSAPPRPPADLAPRGSRDRAASAAM